MWPSTGKRRLWSRSNLIAFMKNARSLSAQWSLFKILDAIMVESVSDHWALSECARKIAITSQISTSTKPSCSDNPLIQICSYFANFFKKGWMFIIPIFVKKKENREYLKYISSHWTWKFVFSFSFFMRNYVKYAMRPPNRFILDDYVWRQR